jgi:hypothetical protein
MTPNMITCPRCGEPIALSETLIAQVRATVETDLRREHQSTTSPETSSATGSKP